MSTDIIEHDGVKVTRFHGGQHRGTCVQITGKPSVGFVTPYVQLTAGQAMAVRDALDVFLSALPDKPLPEVPDRWQCVSEPDRAAGYCVREYPNNPHFERQLEINGTGDYGDEHLRLTVRDAGIVMLSIEQWLANLGVSREDVWRGLALPSAPAS